MKKDIPYRDQLIELSKLYKIEEIKSYLRSKKHLTTSQIELVLLKNKIPLPEHSYNRKKIAEIRFKEQVTTNIVLTLVLLGFITSLMGIRPYIKVVTNEIKFTHVAKEYKSNFKYELLGETLDDACGEAFDKGAKTLGLNYPGGPEIEKISKEGNKKLIEFPRPMINDKSYNFSFSGLKTSLINYIKNNKEYNLPDVAASYQEAIVDTLVFKLDYAMNNFKINTGIICGGVAANSRLRDKLNELNKEILFPSLKYCTDNADMIAFLAMKKAENKNIEKNMDFSAYSRGITL